MALDPVAEGFLAQMAAQGGPQLQEMTPEFAREAFSVFSQLGGEPAQVANIENRTIPGPAGDIPVRIYTPEGTAPFPVLLYFHGGGWVIGDLEVVDAPCRALAKESGCVVVSVDYRLAPEHKFPAASDDCYAATKWVSDNAAEIGVDPSRIAVGGDSAGGQLATVISQMARDKGGPAIAYQVLIYPVTDATISTASYEENAEGYLLTKEGMIWFFNHYMNEDTDRKDPLLSPTYAESLAGLPPAIVITAEYDPLRDEGNAYAEKLKAAGVPVIHSQYPGMIHGFFWLGGVLGQCKQAIGEIGSALRTAFNKN
jgi:acetyl esterase